MELGISVVVPFLDEAGTLEQLYERVARVLDERGEPWEILFVDDGSRDGGTAIVKRLAAADPAVGLVELRRNFGKSAALDAGFRRARGRVVITMDADLQDDPDEIPKLLEALEERSLDVVSGRKWPRLDPVTKTLPSKLFNFVVRALTGLPLADFNCGFKAYRREAIDDLALYGELHRYIPVLVDAKGFAVGEVDVKHHPRRHGRSKFGGERFARGFFDLLTVILLTQYGRRPLHLFGWAGTILFGIGFVILSYLTVLWFAGTGIGQRPLLFLGLLLIMVGVQLFSTGLLGEMINSTRAREPSFSIRHEIAADGRDPAVSPLPRTDDRADDEPPAATSDAEEAPAPLRGPEVAEA
ncbi:MAG: glycosyltransferase family 2 protein [Sandaracinaceae bacterium]|nr:glycosyltransferase family 2 protein [Sandaracinaceae bacterium]